MAKKNFLTLEDFKTCFNLFCCIYGIGTFGIPGNFARGGPAIAVSAMAFMAFANIYSSIFMSKVMLLSPRSLKTFGDLGEWSMGTTGRWLSLISQMASCLLIPSVFLVIGGQLLDGLFVKAFDQSTWTVLMALMVLPVCLVPTLKEGAGSAFTGCMRTIIADVMGVAVVHHDFYIAERVILGMHKKSAVEDVEFFLYGEHLTPTDSPVKQPSDAGVSNSNDFMPNRPSKTSFVSVADSVRNDDAEAEAAEYRGANVIKYSILRIVIIVILVVLVIVFKDHFTDFADFIGASCITLNSIVLPIIYYLIKSWERVPINLEPVKSDVKFPFCDAEFQNTIYYNCTASHDL
ncbi:hypothetical protein PsorP6_014439 [Peronosclerospora sorghi]|uniref:Uncharacterized protein n=1 Tax=Peronosclerospora sorghi TaxID=230839 RepID=A0ACC0VK30_9STRA|nr:hypothetical protein PsorP6_014439 [Peronosclerospora sorghi]